MRPPDEDGQPFVFGICWRCSEALTNRQPDPFMSDHEFKKYFTLEEAVSLLPTVQETLETAQREMDALRDSVILNKRLILAKQSSGRIPSDAEVALLEEKFCAYEDAVTRWVDHFAEQGIILRDLEAGLIDFPYRSKRVRQDFFLCWRLHEDGIFYFHGLNEGFSGRHPITLLPD